MADKSIIFFYTFIEINVDNLYSFFLSIMNLQGQTKLDTQ